MFVSFIKLSFVSSVAMLRSSFGTIFFFILKIHRFDFGAKNNLQRNHCVIPKLHTSLSKMSVNMRLLGRNRPIETSCPDGKNFPNFNICKHLNFELYNTTKRLHRLFLCAAILHLVTVFASFYHSNSCSNRMVGLLFHLYEK